MEFATNDCTGETSIEDRATRASAMYGPCRRWPVIQRRSTCGLPMPGGSPWRCKNFAHRLRRGALASYI
jgi:hypothetical protein